MSKDVRKMRSPLCGAGRCRCAIMLKRLMECTVEEQKRWLLDEPQSVAREERIIAPGKWNLCIIVKRSETTEILLEYWGCGDCRVELSRLLESESGKPIQI